MSLANIWIPNSASFITEYTNTKRNGVKNVNGMKLKAGGKFKFQRDRYENWKWKEDFLRRRNTHQKEGIFIIACGVFGMFFKKKYFWYFKVSSGISRRISKLLEKNENEAETLVQIGEVLRKHDNDLEKQVQELNREKEELAKEKEIHREQ